MMEAALIFLQFAQVGLLTGIFFRLGDTAARLKNLERAVFKEKANV
jgi:hypothetical protein